MLFPEKVSPEIYDILLENEIVKVMKVSFAPGQEDNMHDHYPFTAYILDGGKAQVTMPDGKVNEREFPNGFIAHNGNGVRHKVKNIDSNDINVILIEHKKLGSIPAFDNEVKLSAHTVSPDIYEIVHEDELIKVYTFAIYNMKQKEVKYKIEGMSCVNCALGIEKELKKHQFINFNINFTTSEGIFKIENDYEKKQVQKIIKNLGFS